MKIYKVSVWDDMEDGQQEHTHIQYVTNKKSAEKILSKNAEGYRDEDWMGEINFDLSKKGILEMLNNYFTYPENG